MVTALITGVSGQDGSLLADLLLDEGAVVHGSVRTEQEAAALRAAAPAGLVVHAADLTDPGALAALVAAVEPDEIYHLAGISSVGLSWEQPVLTGQVTGVGAVAVLDAAWRLQERLGRPVRVVQASSAEIFGVPDRTPQDERTALRPVSPYGAAKAYAHQMAQVFRARGLPVATCILYNHESPLRPESFVTRKITAGAARIAVRGAGTLALGNLDARRDWGWAPDYVDAMRRAARHHEAGDYVIGTGRTHSVAEFVAAAFRRAGIERWEAHVTVDPRFVRPADPAEIVADAGRARRVLGWHPTVEFDEVVGRMVDHDLALARAAGAS